jgi:uncharacterized repeat protein (TIGR02543 family)
MTIADKLLQLNQVKQDIKTAIENKGISMTDVAFTEYANKILDMIDSRVEANFFIYKNELYKEVFNIDYLPKITYEKPGLEEKVAYLLPGKNYDFYGTSRYINIKDDAYYFDENFNIQKDRISILAADLAVLETSVEFYVGSKLMPAGKYDFSYETTGGSMESYTYLRITNLDDPSIYTRQQVYHYRKYVSSNSYRIKLDFKDINYNSISYRYENKIYRHQLYLDGKKTIPPIAPKKDGYTFLGWFLEGKDEAYTFNEVLNKDIVLYALFEQQE